MSKLIAILNVVAWSGFWAFGYLAVTADAADTAHLVTAVLLAAAGAGIGVFAYFWLVRHAEAKGYAKRANRAKPSYDDEEIA